MPAAPRLRAFLWVNVACLCWAGNIALGRGFRDDIQPSLLIARRVFRRRPLLEATALATTVAVPLTLAWVGLDGSSSSANWSAGLAAAVAYAAVSASVIGMLAWNRAVQLAAPARADATAR